MKIAGIQRALAGLILALFVAAGAGAESVVSFEESEDRLAVALDGARIGVYVWQDEAIPRPYFAHLAAPGGAPITRTHPPDPAADAGNDDHAAFHPGAWLAFGALGGADFWRNDARVRHVGFSHPPDGGADRGSFEVVNAYERREAGGWTLVCLERCRYTVHAADHGAIIQAESVFLAEDDAPLQFGDQEEMGFGLRLATPLAVRQGGRLVNSEGGRDEAETWGRPAAWCAGFAEADGQWRGASIIAGPDNFRPSWFHSRDYGLIVANPFGKKAMTAPGDPEIPPDSTDVAAGEALALEFAAYLFAMPADAAAPDLAGLYEEYLRVRND